MPQETNLNVAPFFDDFDPVSNYYKVLFKPGYPVQARELNNTQSILQNQIEDVGNHLFKEGAMVIPGGMTYNDSFYAIQIQEEFLGIPVGLYVDQLVGKNIIGRTSGVTAKVVTFITNAQSDRGNYTLYVQYVNSGNTDAAVETFADNEVLVTEESINYATTFISAGEGFANTITSNAAAVGSAIQLQAGIYFLRGYFVDVYDQILLLEQYNNRPTYRIGFQITETIVSSDVDPTLTDNAQGFNNFSAPGADRLKIEATLTKKAIDDFNDTNFVQLSEVVDGLLKRIVSNTQFNLIGKELARRTFDESGDYYINEFSVSVRDSLNNNQGNRGIYERGQVTSVGTEPSENEVIYRVSPGKAYVKGFETERIATTLIPVSKPRTTRSVANEAVNFGFGPTFELNTVTGSATIGFNTTNTLSLRDDRVGVSTVAAGKEIGIARIYDFALESGAYNAVNPDTNQWDLSLFDVQTYTDITVNESVTLSTPTFIQGETSGTTSFLRYDVSAGTAITAYNTKGTFIPGENLIFNGVRTNDRFARVVRGYGNSDVQSVFGLVGGANTFTANVVPKLITDIGNVTISAGDTITGVSTITSATQSFVGVVKVGNLVQYTLDGLSVPTLNKVTANNGDSITVTGVTTVAGVNDGAVPTALVGVNDFKVVGTKIQSNVGSGNQAGNQSLYSIMPKPNIETIGLTNSTLTIRRQFETTIGTNGETPVIQADQNQVFLPFDEERYLLIRSDGSTEVLTQDRVVLSNGNRDIQFIGLSGADASGTILIATLTQSNVTAKIKRKSVSNTLIIDRSKLAQSGTNVGFAGTTNNDGLKPGNWPFGTRVQDPVLSLDVPDLITVHGIFESRNTGPASAPTLTLGSLDGPTATTNDLIIGDTIVGTISGAKAQYLVRSSDTVIEFVHLNNTSFEVNEVVKFEESGVSGIANVITVNSTNISDQYTVDDGQRESIYDYARLIRKPGFTPPVRQIKVYYEKAFYDPQDTGDITTVDSYTSFDYTTEIPTIDNVRTTDIIDGRPRVGDFPLTNVSRSPLEFFGRDFDSNQHSTRFVLASDESMNVSYNYYLGRADRIFLTAEGELAVKIGVPSDDPKLPDGVSQALNVANVFLPPYLYNTENAVVSTIQHRRYQMRDISKLEQRIKSLEYYSSLSLVESTTLNLFIPDVNGLNRFKSGIFVDNFQDLAPQDTTIGVKNSVDMREKILRPSHYTTALNLQVGSDAINGIGATDNANADTRFATIVGGGIRRSAAQTITLDYTEVGYISQPFATRTESVTPFLVQFWGGNITLEPDTDIWIDVNRLETRTIQNEGSFAAIAAALRAEVSTAEDGSRVGVMPIQWNSWETVGVNVDIARSAGGRRNLSGGETGGVNAPWGATGDVTNVTTTTTTNQARTGSQQTIIETIQNETLGDRVVSRELIHFVRSRNVEFTGRQFRPFTQVYPFFDGVTVADFCFNKLVEIEMVSGTFQVGENVLGQMLSANTTEDIEIPTIAEIAFRVAAAAHKYGPYDSPTDFYDDNPYDRTNILPEEYSETSTVLNIDTFSLQNSDQPQYEGRIRTGMILTGQTSGAAARVTDVRLITDRIGTIIGSFRIPDVSDTRNPVFETGKALFRLTSDPLDSEIEGVASTSGEEMYYSQGSLETTQETTLSLRHTRLQVNDNFLENRNLINVTQSEEISNIVANAPPPPPPPPPAPPAPPRRRWNSIAEVRAFLRGFDPIAQTFSVADEVGVFLSSVDIFFSAKDPVIPMSLSIRETRDGVPTEVILPFSEIEVTPDQITTSDDSTIATNIQFSAPVYVNAGGEYAITMLSASTEYRVWISRLGEVDVTTLDQGEVGQTLVSTQPLLGSLFKSQNASTWTPSQYEDLKFNLYRSSFQGSGFVNFYNPELPPNLSRISRDAITINSREISVGIGTTLHDPKPEPGNEIRQVSSTGTGTLVSFAGSITDSLSITNAGVGYTPTSGHFTYIGVPLTNVTGNGRNGAADIHIENGVATAATTRAGGSGYVVGDVLTPTQIGNSQLGAGMKISVSNISGTNELIIDNVQGTFDTTHELTYVDNNGNVTLFNSNNGNGVVPVSPIRTTTDGQHMKIFQRNHGMYSEVNRVTLSDIGSDVQPTRLSADYTSTDTGFISIASSEAFGTFEGVGVGTTNPGYAKIGNEIFEYTGVANNTLIGITRGVDDTLITGHVLTDLVYKYELDGVSLRRINKNHNLADVTVPDPIGLDFYHVRIDMSDTNVGIDRSPGTIFGALYFNTNTKAGGNRAKGTYNLPFNLIIPKINTIEPDGTSLVFQANTISETSISGNEPSYVEKGFEEITNFAENYFSDPRMIASQINEDTFLSGTPGSKSFTTGINLFTSDNRLSPAIDLNDASVVFISNRINAPVSNYATDGRVNTIVDDPHNFIYVTKTVLLENAASGLKVYLDAYIGDVNDVRLFYALDQQDSLAEDCIFTPFPGHGNFDVNGNLISSDLSDGSSDIKIPKYDNLVVQEPLFAQFREYTFSNEDLPAFNAFRIKIVGTSTNQSVVPQLKNLRVIALA